ncbi:MAG: hypothetical protein M9916_08085 [Crocinitomicaceae bacterium]|nr:hypothetical protein [Crocinitomicaceae bacterium]
MNTILKNWSWLRVARITLGVFIIGEGIHSSEWGFILLGIAFTIMPILNIGCCSNGTCATFTPNQHLTALDNEEVIFEEIK